MPSYRRAAGTIKAITDSKKINWFPGHMYSGMQAMIGKLNTIDCVVEVHDARIPFTGRNTDLKKQLGTVKPHVLVLNKTDLADLSDWNRIKRKLDDQGDSNVLLTDLTGSEFSLKDRGFPKLMTKVVDSINASDRYNRQSMNSFKIMIVGIPNVGKSTLINRLRQHHIGLKGSPARTGPFAGVTRNVETLIKVCARPLIYSIDTPGVLQPGSLKNQSEAMRLALCSTINDAVVNVSQLANYLLKYLIENENYQYQMYLELEKPVGSLEELVQEVTARKRDKMRSTEDGKPLNTINPDDICWHFIKGFRKGYYGKVMLD